MDRGLRNIAAGERETGDHEKISREAAMVSELTHKTQMIFNADMDRGRSFPHRALRLAGSEIDQQPNSYKPSIAQGVYQRTLRLIASNGKAKGGRIVGHHIQKSKSTEPGLKFQSVMRSMTITPAWRNCSSMLSTDPFKSMARLPCFRITADRPSLRASSAEYPTQKS